MATVYLLPKKGSVWFVEVTERCFFLLLFFSDMLVLWECGCILARFSQGHKNAYMCIHLHLSVFQCACMCVCVWNDNPVITASVLASQRLTALFYSDLYNQCHISNTTNQTLRVSPVQPFTHMRSRTHTNMHTTCPPSCSQLATILCQTDVN